MCVWEISLQVYLTIARLLTAPRQGRGQRGDSDLPLESLRDARFILRHRARNDGNSETSSVRQCQVCIYLR